MATSKKSNKSIEKHVKGLVDLIQSQKCETMDVFIDKYGPIKNINDAYDIQNNVCKILEQNDETQFGYKIGGTAQNVRDIWNISEPFISPFYNVWHYLNNQTVEKEKGLTLGVESEFVFKIGTELNIDDKKGQQLTLDDIYPLIDCVYPGYELIEPRIVYKDNADELNRGILNLPIEILIADLCWTGGIVIGQESGLSDVGYSSWKEYDEKECRDAAVEIYINNQQEGIGYGREVLDSPFNSLLYVYNQLLKNEQTIKQGQYVTTGTVTGCVFLDKGDTAESVFENIGDVELKLV